jgi:copper(I)-binding protein
MAASGWAQPTVEVTDAWQRGTPPGQSKTAAYMTLSNPTATIVRVVSVSSTQARTVEIHESSQVDGMWQMRRLEDLTIAPGASVHLQPGGIHLMVFGLVGVPRPGESMPFALELQSGEIIPVQAEVRAPGSSGH